MFATPLMTFKLPSYVAKLTHLFAEAPSPPPSRTRFIIKLIVDFLDIETEQCEDVIDMVVQVVDYASYV
jgi:hypothetical protein